MEKDFEHAANALADLPSQFGSWHLESKQGLGDSAMDLLQCRAFINHSYRNADTGQLVTVAVMVGPGAKMSIHVPEICFEAKNYSRNVQKAEIDKFYRDIDSAANSDVQCAVFVSLKTGISSRDDFELEVRNGKPIIFMHSLEDNFMNILLA